MTFDEWFVRNNDGDDSGKDIAEYAWKAGAASRDAEVAELVAALEHSVLYVPELATVPGIAAALAKVRKP